MRYSCFYCDKKDLTVQSFRCDYCVKSINGRLFSKEMDKSIITLVCLSCQKNELSFEKHLNSSEQRHYEFYHAPINII